MKPTWPTEIALLAELVAIPSVSGSEEAVARHVEGAARAWDLDVTRDGTGVKVEVRSPRAGPTLALVSHLDVVPPGEGWTRDPFTPAFEDGRLYGRGSGDAKASVAAMLAAAHDVAAGGGPPRGRLLILLGHGEETRHTSMPELVARAGPIDAAVVGISVTPGMPTRRAGTAAASSTPRSAWRATSSPSRVWRAIACTRYWVTRQ